ncbi:MAG TPA: ribonuclease HII, partial [Bacillota bacterium]
ISGLDDSKRLDPATRARVAGEVRRVALGIGIGAASVEEIDRFNIFHAAQLAMRRAIAALPQGPDYLIVDGLRLRGVTVPQVALPGGDRKSNSVAAASVVAKVYRDSLMDELDRRYPGYGFARHKGYATPEHRRALAMYGPCAEHRAFARKDLAREGSGP